MAENKLESFFKDLLTLEVTTVVVDDIPSDVVLDVKQQLTATGMKMLNQAGGPAAQGGAATSVSNESAPIGSRGSKKESAAKRATVPLKALFGEIAAREAEAEATAEMHLRSEAARGPGAGARSAEDAEQDRRRAAESRRRKERARVIEGLLPEDDAALATLPAEQRLTLRRVATLADYPIALHTTISVGGDLTTLCAREHTQDSGAAVRALHKEGVSNAIGWWKSLAEGAVTFLGTLFNAIGGARPGGGSGPGGGGPGGPGS